MQEHRYLKNIVTLGYEPEKCTGCGRCLEVCPHAVFELEKGKALMRDRNACMECGACAKNCPFQAISVRPGAGCAWAILLAEIRGLPAPSCG